VYGARNLAVLDEFRRLSDVDEEGVVVSDAVRHVRRRVELDLGLRLRNELLEPLREGRMRLRNSVVRGHVCQIYDGSPRR
jgi:hypothetical protein